MANGANDGKKKTAKRKVYRTGGGGYAEAIWPTLAATLWLVLLLSKGRAFDTTSFIVFVVLVPILTYAYALSCFLRERNARVALSDEGLAVRNWRNVARFIPWESISGAIWADSMGIRLYLELDGPDGRRRLFKLAYTRLIPEPLERLRDEIVARQGLSEVTPTKWERVFHRERTIWR